MSKRRGPVLIEETRSGPSPSAAPPVPDGGAGAEAPPDGQAMRLMASLAARRASPLVRWFWRSAGALLVLLIGAGVWQAVANLVAASPILGAVALAVLAVFVICALGLVLREITALSRLEKVAALHDDAAAAKGASDVSAARDVAARLSSLYAARDELSWHRDRLGARKDDVFDADDVLQLAERELLTPLDTAARREVEAAARQVAAVTALVPLALADVVAAFAANLRMIRRIAEIYGGRSGTIGSWRLTRAVMTHLVATGAVAVGDDLIGSVAGGSVLARVSRRFGEGVVNGALTARVGVAAMEVCRPLPFSARPAPQIHHILGRAMSGLFPASKETE